MHSAEASPVKGDSDPDQSPRAAAHLSWTLMPPPLCGRSIHVYRQNRGVLLPHWIQEKKKMDEIERMELRRGRAGNEVDVETLMGYSQLFARNEPKCGGFESPAACAKRER